jgi:hypothetical protein
LENLNLTFSSLLHEIFKSELSSDLKKYLLDKIEDILKSIRRYTIDGTEGLEKTVKSLVCDLTLGESRLADKDKTNPVFKKFQAVGLSLFLYIFPTPWDIIGAVPDYQQFWQPKFEELVEGQKEIEKILKTCPNTSEIIKQAENKKIFSRGENIPKLTESTNKESPSSEGKSENKIKEDYGDAEIIEE